MLLGMMEIWGLSGAMTNYKKKWDVMIQKKQETEVLIIPINPDWLGDDVRYDMGCNYLEKILTMPIYLISSQH